MKKALTNATNCDNLIVSRIVSKVKRGDKLNNREKVAKKLVSLRGTKTREEVAKAIKVSISAIAMYENGYRMPRDETKIKIADYYGVSVEQIFFEQQ